MGAPDADALWEDHQGAVDEWTEHTPVDARLTGRRGAVDAEELLVAVYHRDGVSTQRIQPGDTITIGRSHRCDIYLNDQSTSRVHAEMAYGNDGLTIRDRQSTNGTRVNGEEIGVDASSALRGFPYALAVGDVVVVGNAVLCVHQASAVVEAPGAIDNHDDFIEALKQEVTRARTFERALALVLVSSSVDDKRHVSTWYPKIQAHIRSVDRMAVFSPCAVEVLLAEADAEEMQRMAQKLMADLREQGVPLACGGAVFPRHARSAEELVEVARLALNETSATTRLVIGRPAQKTEPTDFSDNRVQINLLRNPTMVSLHSMLPQLAATSSAVLIQGQQGTGKRFVAKLIHRLGPGRQAPLRYVDCTLLSGHTAEEVLFGWENGGRGKGEAGVLEQATGGTVVLEEIGALAPAAQAELARFLARGAIRRVGSQVEVPLDVRVFATTSDDLAMATAEGRFDNTLSKHLKTETISIPPLSQRRDDILPLAAFFIRQANQAGQRTVKGFDVEAETALIAYRWPGNVRELRNVIERAAAATATPVIRAADLPRDVWAGVGTNDARYELREERATERTRPARVRREPGHLVIADSYDDVTEDNRDASLHWIASSPGER